MLSFQGQMEQPAAEAVRVAWRREQCVQRPGGGGGEGEVLQEGRRNWGRTLGPELEGPAGPPKEGERGPFQDPKPLKEKVTSTCFTDSNCPLSSSAPVYLGMPGMGVETHSETDRKRNLVQCRVRKMVPTFHHI